ncbi:hypothetical protein HZH66_010039 [Vespula vulgaris]|uniref:Uncharacterized protein n=1 Tax=Vespula vulgaris TaxID=7454 RepID=A0A834JKQ7_VESVU|nr:hypothetical protein HZH66_010039 [Vespula vulgaris]
MSDKTKLLIQHPNATNSSETSVGGVSGACGSSGMPGTGDAGCSSSRGGSSSGAGGGAGTTGQGCEQVPSSHSTRESHAKLMLIEKQRIKFYKTGNGRGQ